MHPIEFQGSVPIGKPENMTDEECYSLWAKFGIGTLLTIFDFDKKKDKLLYAPPDILFRGVVAGVDSKEYPYYMTAWKPNKEDLDALNRGEPVYIKTLSKSLPPMSVFTLDENGNGNF